MANGVGLWIGAAQSTAVIVRDGDASVTADGTGPLTETIVRDTVLHMSAEGTTLGGPATDDAATVTVTDFVDLVGDPEGVPLDDGAAYRAEDLYATALFCLLDVASADLTGDTEVIAAYPPEWPADVRTAVRDSLDYLGLRHVRLQYAPVSNGTARTPAEPARAAAVAAVAAVAAAADEPPTEELPVLRAAMVDEQAYSAVLPVVAAANTVLLPPIAAPLRVAPTAPTAHVRTTRTPLLVAAGFAVAMVLTGATIAFALRTDTSSEIPAITAIGPAPTTTPPALAPAPVLPAAAEPISFPTVTSVEAPPPTAVWTPPPAPVIEVAASVPPVESPSPTPTPTLPPATTTTPTTTTTPPTTTEDEEPAPPEPTESTAEQEKDSSFETPEGAQPNRNGIPAEADDSRNRSPWYPFDTGRDYDYYFGDTDNLGNP
ncbi:hypothetical protein OG921_02310 [Aldersonia sp. NBC_00410]|uniref:hypothetical protein n=1 Tax=Aldersonia sp. NBC_00410 TaxID=2975954 RepID=UPI002252F117|nr:hypothetical protein [Aldersonia sp. NBC_00410]MCX5042028.1 hypothetical protein [Aldersonia sp. NBC_00410]